MYITIKNKLRLPKHEADELKFMCEISKNIYNVALYEYRQNSLIREIVSLSKTLNIDESLFMPIPFDHSQIEKFYLPSKFDLPRLVRENENWKFLNYDISFYTVNSVSDGMSSFFSNLKRFQSGKKNSSTEGMPRPPNYQKDSYILKIRGRQLNYINNKLRIPIGEEHKKRLGEKSLWLTVNHNDNSFIFERRKVGTQFQLWLKVGKYDFRLVQFVRILPDGDTFWIEYVIKTDPVKVELSDKVMGIDLGIDNFAACVIEDHAFLINGRQLKSYNRWYNKTKAKYHRALSKAQSKKRYSNELRRLDFQKKKIVRNFILQTTAEIIKQCIEHKIGFIVMEDLTGIKHKPKLNKKTKQNFMVGAHSKFKNVLKAKCEYYGIEVIEIDPAYTSQTCSRCQNIYKASRRNKSYICKKCKTWMNADINAAINIAHKSKLESARRIEYSGRVTRPLKISPIALR